MLRVRIRSAINRNIDSTSTRRKIRVKSRHKADFRVIRIPQCGENRCCEKNMKYRSLACDEEISTTDFPLLFYPIFCNVFNSVFNNISVIWRLPGDVLMLLI